MVMEKEMATHSSILAWKIPWTEEPGGLQLMCLQRVGHNWVTELNCTCVLPSWTLLPPSSLPHPSELSQSSGFEWSCIKAALIIYFTYDNVHISMSFFQSSHLLLFPHNPKVCSLHLPIIQSEVSQKEKHQCSILMHIRI